MNEAALSGMMERAMFHYRAIGRHNIFGIGCAVPVEPLSKVVRELNLPPALENPYYLAWRAVITLSIEGSKHLNLNEPIQFVFDDQSEKTNIIKAWDDFYASVPPDVRARIRGTPSFLRDDDVMPLQAADLIAWWARRQYVKDKDSMKSLFPTSWSDGKDPDLLFGNMSETAIRKQLQADIANAQKIAASAAHEQQK
jgi:hypothetical protein